MGSQLQSDQPRSSESPGELNWEPLTWPVYGDEPDLIGSTHDHANDANYASRDLPTAGLGVHRSACGAE